MPSRRNKPAANQVTIESILSDHSPEVRQLAEQLRKLIKETVPQAVERPYPGWRAIGYRHPDAGYFCGLFPLADRVDVAFEFGVLLPDPNAMLEGEGKQVRYVRIRQVQDIQTAPLIALIQAAIDLPSNRQVRLEMVRLSVRSQGTQA